MTSILYAIVDAAGNIYPGTFAKHEREAWFRHLLPGLEPGLEWCSGDLFDSHVKKATDCGDRAVRCLIETSENVKVTLLK